MRFVEFEHNAAMLDKRQKTLVNPDQVVAVYDALPAGKGTHIELADGRVLTGVSQSVESVRKMLEEVGESRKRIQEPA
jgi:hypothetical protein